MSDENIEKNYSVDVKVTTQYLPESSLPMSGEYAFSYHITITNNGNIGAKLLSRHWFVVDGNHHIEEIQGVGVVGEQPYLAPGEFFYYSSGVVINTPVGSMHGTYEMLADDGKMFLAEIKPFSLSVPNAIN